MSKSNYNFQRLFVLVSVIPVLAFGFVWVQNENIKVLQFNKMPTKVCTLPAKVNETSGIIYFDEAIWTFNDSGGNPELYCINTAGEIVRTVVIENARNNDWEDITMDETFIYIGDFGNNTGDRKDLTIYKVHQKSIKEGKSHVSAGKICFSYTDQGSFEAMNRHHNFDCESIISFGDSLILFSKNWIDKNTRMCKVPKTAGNYKLTPLDSFVANGLVTGADYCVETKKLALIGYKAKTPFIYLIEDFNGQNFASHQIFRINFPVFYKSQTEGICWTDKNTIMLSTEETKEFKPALYKISLSNMLTADTEN